jgi:hypothetical protein
MVHTKLSKCCATGLSEIVSICKTIEIRNYRVLPLGMIQHFWLDKGVSVKKNDTFYAQIHLCGHEKSPKNTIKHPNIALYIGKTYCKKT